MKRLFALFGLCVLVSIFSGCSDSKQVEEARVALLATAERIDAEFASVREVTRQLAKTTEALYLADSIAAVLPTVDASQFALSDSGVFYKPKDDGGSAVFVSGCVPVDDAVKEIVYFTTPLDDAFKQIISKNRSVVQAYYNDKNSYNRIYPYFDVLTQYEPKMVIPDFNFYYLADATHNPNRDVVWVDEPYVDPAGRGWMVSSIAPVYADGELAGVAGLDITINTVTERTRLSSGHPTLIFDKRGLLVSIDDSLTRLFSLPALKDHRYMETIKADTFAPDQYNLLKSKSPETRQLMTTILEQKKGRFDAKDGGIRYTILAEPIPELGWVMITVLER